MNVLVAGGHGKIGLQLLKLLAARGDVARGLIRDPAQAPEVEAVGAYPVIDDLEADDESGLRQSVEGSDAVVFAAGGGPGSGPARKRTVDLGGAVKLIQACEDLGVRRYVMVSAIGVDKPGSYVPEMEAYYEAKREADEALEASSLDWTIVRPGGLTDDPGTGSIRVGTPLPEGGQVARADVATALAAVLDQPGTAGLAFDLVGGETPITEAIAALVP